MFTFETLGVQAYLGAAGSPLNDSMILTAAARIFGVEARHAAIIGMLQGKSGEGGFYMGNVETPLPPTDVLAAARPFLTTPDAPSVAGPSRSDRVARHGDHSA